MWNALYRILQIFRIGLFYVWNKSVKRLPFMWRVAKLHKHKYLKIILDGCKNTLDTQTNLDYLNLISVSIGVTYKFGFERFYFMIAKVI